LNLASEKLASKLAFSNPTLCRYVEEDERLTLTPFEKNLEIWRQLWRVCEKSDIVVQVVDARDPMFYNCPDLEAYVHGGGGHTS
jgi:ribosome biogenesis GTPase A